MTNSISVSSEPYHPVEESDCAFDRTRLQLAAPASLSAVTGLPLQAIIKHFPYNPDKPWTNQRQMKAVILELELTPEKLFRQLPECGVAFIYLAGKWGSWNRKHKLMHSHWIGVKDGLLYDVTVDGWYPQKEWSQFVYPFVREGHPEAVGYRFHMGFEISKEGQQ